MPEINPFISCPVMDLQSEKETYLIERFREKLEYRRLEKEMYIEALKEKEKVKMYIEALKENATMYIEALEEKMYLMENMYTVNVLGEEINAYKALKERVYCPLKKDALRFEDNLCFEAKNPLSHMGLGRPLKARLRRDTLGYHSTTESHMTRSTMYLPINMNVFRYFSVKNEKVNQSFTTENEFLERINEPYDGNPLHTGITLKTSQLRDKFTGCDLNDNSEHFSHEKRKKTVHRVSSFVMASIVFLSVAMEMCSQLSIIQLQPKSGPILFLSTILKLFGFMVYVSATAAMIVNGAPFSGMQSSMLMFWATFMLVNSAKSLTEVYLPLLGIIFTGCYVLVPSAKRHHHNYMKVNNENNKKLSF